MSDTGVLIDVQEAAKRLKLSTRKVYALAAAGELASYRFGAAVRFDPADLDAYKTACRSPATTRAAGSISLTVSSPANASALTNYFQKARPGRKPSTSTEEKPRASGKLQLVGSGQSR